MKFIPKDPTEAMRSDVPFLDELSADDGWQGQATTESVAALRAKISTEIGRLHGTVTKFLEGDYETEDHKYLRPGVELEYQIERDGQAFTGRLAVAGPPWHEPYGGNKHHASYKKSVATARDKSLRVALFNIWKGLIAGRIMEALSPGYSALIPWLLAPGTDETFSQLWNMGSRALPSPDDDAVEGEYREKE